MAITIGGMGPDGKFKPNNEPDAYNRAAVGVRPAAHALGKGLRETPGQIGSALNTAGQVMSGVADSVAPAARNMSHAIGTAGRNMAATDYRGAAGRLLDASGRAATGTAQALARSGAGQYVIQRVMDPNGLAKPTAEGLLAARAGFAGEPLPRAPTAQPVQARTAAAPAADLSGTVAGVGKAIGAGARGLAATNLMRPTVGGSNLMAATGADFVGPPTSQARQPAGAPVMQQATPTGAVRDQFRQDQAASIPGGTQRASRGSFSAMGPERQGPSPTWQSQAAALSRPFNPAPEMDMTRTAPNPSGQRASILDPRSQAGEMVRRARNASSDFHFRGGRPNLTRSQREQILATQMGERNFWLDQAASLGGDAQARFLAAQQARSQESQANAGNATTLQRGVASDATQLQATGMQQAGETQRGEAQNAARLQAEQMQQQGAMDRTQAQIDAELRRPQRPIQLADGTLARIGEYGQLVPYSLPDGSAARGPMASQQQRDYTLEANDRLFSSILDMQRNVDGTMPPDAVARATAQMQQYRGGQMYPDGTRLNGPNGKVFVVRNGEPVEES